MGKVCDRGYRFMASGEIEWKEMKRPEVPSDD